MKQETLNAGQIRLNDLLIFGNALYRISHVDHTDLHITRVDMICDQMWGSMEKVRIEVAIHKDHIVTVMRTD